MTAGGSRAGPAGVPPGVARWPSAMLHVDMDAFYVAVEVRRDPSLVGRAVVVGGNGARGVVAAASYEARAYGVRSAMPSVQARRLCPQALFLPGDHSAYAEASSAIMAIFRNVTPLVEPLSLDEAFLDVTGAQARVGSPAEIAAQLRQRVADEQHLPCSVGVASTKFLAKLASEAAKPTPTPQGARAGRGVWVVTLGEELAFLHPLPVKALWGVGPATLTKLQRIGVATVGDLAAMPVGTLVAALGEASGRHLFELAHNRDPRRVEPDRETKSIGHEETFPVDRFDREDLDRELLRLSDAVARRLRGAGLTGRTVQLKVRFGDFTTITRSRRVAEPLDNGLDLARAARQLLAKIDVTAGIRLLGVSASGLGPARLRQLQLDLTDPWGPTTARSVDGVPVAAHLTRSERPSAAPSAPGPAPDAASRSAPGSARSAPAVAGSAGWAGSAGSSGARPAAWLDAHDTVDAIRQRFGAAAIGPASLAGKGRLEVFERGQQEWGPADNVRTSPDEVPEAPPSR
ncbi:MAG: DNA polymerase IV [Acidimicrobiales bacterium]